jgi:GNAT superfamily N-acetyltransferase
MRIEFKSKSNNLLVFGELHNTDELQLGNFFCSLSENTRSKFEPHPLTREQAAIICASIEKDNTKRFVVTKFTEIIGYFILNFNSFENESARYKKYGINIDSRVDPVFAPCIADNYQNQGIASKVMRFILEYAHEKKLKSIVLMGGTQKSNALARGFYKKFGFEEYGEFYTAYNSLNNIDMKLNL